MSETVRWLADPATARLDPVAVLDGLAAGLARQGLAPWRLSAWIPTKHPELWGEQLVWERGSGARVLRRVHDVASTSDYVGSPAEALHRNGTSWLRCRLDREPDRGRFAMLRAMSDAGCSDYVLLSLEPGSERAPWISFVTDREGGWDDAQVELLTSLAPLLSLHVQLVAARFATRSLLEVYLGAHAADRVLDGAFRRGTGADLDCALWFCDMRGFTALSDRVPARDVVRILDRYFEHVATPIDRHGGEILKFIGDAALAVFPIDTDPRGPCRRALAAAEEVLAAIEGWSADLPEPVALGVALHVGRVHYGNIGGRARLDFTVIGASVNEVCRVESLCKELGSPLLLTSGFAAALGRDDVVSRGRHALKGVSEPQEIFTLPGYDRDGSPPRSRS
jgi:adenylate cyclase